MYVRFLQKKSQKVTKQIAWVAAFPLTWPGRAAAEPTTNVTIDIDREGHIPQNVHQFFAYHKITIQSTLTYI